MAACRLSMDQPVEIREENGRVVIEPIRQDAYDLAALVAEISDENRHDEVETGSAVGREAW